jgi:TldD protein
VNYQKTRDQAHVMDQKESDGCSYADHWSSVQFQRMPNVSVQPGKDPLTPEQMIKDVERGIYIVGAGSFSIDQQRYNFQFGGQLFYEIEKGEIKRACCATSRIRRTRRSSGIRASRSATRVITTSAARSSMAKGSPPR